MEFTTVDETVWNKLPAPTSPKKSDKYEPVLNAIEQRQIVEVITNNEKEAKGIRIMMG